MIRSAARRPARRLACVVPLLIGSLALCAPAAAQDSGGPRYRAIHAFEGGPEGSWPTGALAGDPAVALFGVTTDGGKGAEFGNGTVFRLTRKGTDVWRHEVIFDKFTRKVGYDPQALVAVGDRLVGVANAGGAHKSGTIFELRRRGGPSSRRWEHVVLHDFNFDDGAEVQALIHDEDSGVIYGATSRGGDESCGFGDGCGVIFALRPDAKGDGWSFEVIHRFVKGAGGWRPWGPALTVSRGVLYGTTHFGGADCVDDSPYDFDCGVVYRLDPPETDGGAWTKTVLHAFDGKDDGARPSNTLVVRGGSVFGTTIMNGATKRGTVFKVGAKGGRSDFSVVYAIPRNQYYVGGLTAGAGGVLYATGETNACSSVFSLTPSNGSGPYSMSVLRRFKEADGCFPDTTLRFVASENTLYGATWDGGEADAGTIYRLRLPEPPTQ